MSKKDKPDSSPADALAELLNSTIGTDLLDRAMKEYMCELVEMPFRSKDSAIYHAILSEVRRYEQLFPDFIPVTVLLGPVEFKVIIQETGYNPHQRISPKDFGLRDTRGFNSLKIATPMGDIPIEPVLSPGIHIQVRPEFALRAETNYTIKEEEREDNDDFAKLVDELGE